MRKQTVQLSKPSLKYVIERLTELADTGKAFQLEITEWRKKGTDQQRKTYWLWMREIADWAKEAGIKQDIYVKGKLVARKDWDKDFSHEFIMQYFYPKNEDGSRYSLKEVLKDRGEMCALMDRLNAWCAEKGIFLTIPRNHFYWEYKNQSN